VRHAAFLAAVVLYVVILGENWGIYTAAILIALYRRYDGELSSVPFSL